MVEILSGLAAYAGRRRTVFTDGGSLQLIALGAAYEDPMKSKGLGRWLQGDLQPPK
jgi:hypothetical protein